MPFSYTLLRMKNALVAIDPMALKESSFEHLCDAIRVFQEKRILARTSIVSATHASQFLMPYSYYREHKDELAQEARNKVRAACTGKFQFVNNRVLQSDSHTNEEIVSLISRYGRRTGMDLLVVASNDRKGLPYWFLGSFSETASLTAKMPILVFKGYLSKLEISRNTNFVVGVDVAAPPSSQDINWLVGLAKAAQARIHLLYIEPRERPLVDRLQLRKNRTDATRILERIAGAFESRGIPSTSSIREETRSVAHTVVDVAEKKCALLTIVTTAERSTVRKLLLGSTARHTLALTKRPFLSLRMS